MSTTVEQLKSALQGVQIRFATGTVTQIIAPVAAQPGTYSGNAGDTVAVSDGDTLTIVKTGAGAGTVVFESDASGDGVTEGNVSMGVIYSQLDALTWLAANITSYFGGNLVMTYDSMSHDVSLSTVDTGASASFNISTGTGGLSGIAFVGVGTDGTPGSGNNIIELAPAVVEKTNVPLFVSGSVLGDNAWTGDVLICGKSGDTLYPLFRVVCPNAGNSAETGRNYGLVLVPASWGEGESIEPDRYGSGGQPADLTAPLPANVAIVALTTGTRLGTGIGNETTGSDFRAALAYFQTVIP